MLVYRQSCGGIQLYGYGLGWRVRSEDGPTQVA